MILWKRPAKKRHRTGTKAPLARLGPRCDPWPPCALFPTSRVVVARLRRRRDDIRLPGRGQSSSRGACGRACAPLATAIIPSVRRKPGLATALFRPSCRSAFAAGEAFSGLARLSSLATTRLKLSRPLQLGGSLAAKEPKLRADLRRTCVGHATPSNAASSSPRVHSLGVRRGDGH